jgi:hypothetical protein
MTLESCDGDLEYDRSNKSLFETVSYEYTIQMTLIDDIVGDIYAKHWFPIMTDNTNWTHIEYACRIRLKVFTLSNSVGSFEHVCLLMDLFNTVNIVHN